MARQHRVGATGVVETDEGIVLVLTASVRHWEPLADAILAAWGVPVFCWSFWQTPAWEPVHEQVEWVNCIRPPQHPPTVKLFMVQPLSFFPKPVGGDLL